MVRQYQRKCLSARNGKTFKAYQSYSKVNLSKAIADVKSKKLSLREAALKYDVPKSTIERHSKGQISYESAGHPTLFSKEEENTFITYIQVVAEWGFPFDLLDLRIFAQRYLNRIGRKVYTLSDNLPGRDWAANFLIRHKSVLSNRLSSNISSDRAKVNETDIDSFFDNYQETIRGIEPDCIINYDETNLTDDPGSQKFIFRRGTKYPEKIMNNSKTAISLMFSGAADGTLLPVYTVYKSEHLYDTWVLGGPDDARYNKSRSGWFDSVCFEDWFNSIIIPFAKTKNGKRILIIGDNLSSHFSENVLKSCEKFNITFACLPPKATHLMQPLDVAYYAPLKHYWRQILTEWKKKEGRKQKTLAKNAFPGLLQKLLNKLEASGKVSQNLISGFEKTGLYPVNRDRPKTRLPKTQQNISEVTQNVSAVVVEMLEELRGTQSDTLKPRKKRCNVPAGKSITVSDVLQKETDGSEKKSKSKGKGKGNRTRLIDTSEKENEKISEDTQRKKRKKTKPLQKGKSCDSETSNSDIEMSVHADSDIIDVDIEIPESPSNNDMHFMSEFPYSPDKLIVASPYFSEPVISDGENNVSTVPDKNLTSTEDISAPAENEMSLPSVRVSASPPAVSSPITTVEVISIVADCSLSSSEVLTLPNENAEDVSIDHENESLPPIVSSTPRPISLSPVTIDLDVSTAPEIKIIPSAVSLMSMARTEDVATVPRKKKVQQKKINKPKKCKLENKKNIEIKPPNLSVELSSLKNTFIETEAPGCSNQEKEIPVNYNLHDYVIVRYILKKKVDYFVGQIIEIREGKVKISFFNKVGKYDNTIFRKPKKQDVDIVDDSMIVRSVGLMAINEAQTDFVFYDEDDYVFFDY